MPQVNISILFTGLALAYCFTTVFRGRLFQRRPFNCIKCMTGWFSLVIGLLAYHCWGLLYLPLGVFTGAIYEKICMRWL